MAISHTFLLLFGRTGGATTPSPDPPHCFHLRRYGRQISLKSQLMAERNSQLMAERNSQLMAERNSQLMAERNSHLMAERNSQLMAEYEFTRTKNF